MITICLNCQKEKKIHANGLCSACWQREYRHKYPERMKAINKRTYQKNIDRRRKEARDKDKMQTFFRSVRETSKRRGFKFEISIFDIRDLFIKTNKWYFANCEYCKSAVIIGFNATIDHKNAIKRTIKCNIVIACKFCNAAKGKLQPKEYLNRLKADVDFLNEIRNKNQKILKAWLASEVWNGSFEDLINLLFESQTQNPVLIGNYHPIQISTIANA